MAKDVINIILNLLKEKISSSVLYNLLMSLSHLAKHKDLFAAPLDESKFSDKITDFHEFYSQLNPNGNTINYSKYSFIDESGRRSVEKQSILNLC